MNDSYHEFQERVARIYEKRSKPSFFRRRQTRAVYKTGQDGYTVIRGAKQRRPFPWTGVMLVLVAFFGMKGVIMARIGPEVYSGQISSMPTSNWLEKAGAWTAQPDPVSLWVAQQIQSLS